MLVLWKTPVRIREAYTRSFSRCPNTCIWKLYETHPLEGGTLVIEKY